MSYRKGEDTPATKRRRLQFRAVIEEREEPFRDADRAELDAEAPVHSRQIPAKKNGRPSARPNQRFTTGLLVLRCGSAKYFAGTMHRPPWFLSAPITTLVRLVGYLKKIKFWDKNAPS